jgi:hypothetical protein
MNVSSFVVLSAGSVDVAASTAKFTAALNTYIAERETENGQIATAVSAVFDSHKGKVLTMPTLAALALQQLNAQPENFKALTDRVTNYIRENSRGEGAPLRVTKGKGGGVSRRADAPAPAAQ